MKMGSTRFPSFTSSLADGLTYSLPFSPGGGFLGKKIVLTGYMAHVCVSTTARQAAQRGYEVLLAEDGIGDRDIPGATGEEVTKMVMNELGDAFGTVVNGSSIK